MFTFNWLQARRKKEKGGPEEEEALTMFKPISHFLRGPIK
jgi:hypothetical protein